MQKNIKREYLKKSKSFNINTLAYIKIHACLNMNILTLITFFSQV